jgi:DNA-binding XRE family transcriptional regulator
MRDIARLDDYRTVQHIPRTMPADDPGHSDAPEPVSATPGPSQRSPRREPVGPEPLWREALGERLRAHRTGSGRTLAETAGRAGVSPQYLSEMERGRKEPSSEMIAAVAGALGLTLADLVGDVAQHLAAPRPTSVPAGPQLLATAA